MINGPVQKFDCLNMHNENSNITYNSKWRFINYGEGYDTIFACLLGSTHRFGSK